MSNDCLVMVLPGSNLIRTGGQIANDTFYCPVMGCKYNFQFGQPTRYFKTQKLLKQVSITYYTLFRTFLLSANTYLSETICW